MLLNDIYKDPVKFAIKVFDAVSQHNVGYNVHVPLLSPQVIALSPEMYPRKPPDRSQLYRVLYKPDLKPFVGGVPIGKVVRNSDSEQHRFICNQFKHKLSSAWYHPPIHLVFPWHKCGGEKGAETAAERAQLEYNEKYGTWRNKYRINYDELTDAFFLQVKINHMYSECLFECDLIDADAIFKSFWHISHSAYTDRWNETKYRYHIRQRDEATGKPRKDLSLTKFMFPDVPRRTYVDNNLFNNRRYNIQMAPVDPDEEETNQKPQNNTQ